MNTLKNLRNGYVAIEVAYNDLDMVGDVNLLTDLCEIEANTLYPTKVRADRRRKTAVACNRKARRAKSVGVKDEYLVKNKVGKAMQEVHMDKIAYAGNKGVADWDINEGISIFEHDEKVRKFYRLVEDWLVQSELPNVIPDDEEFFFEPDECFPFDDDDMFEFVDEAPKKYPFDGMSDVSKAIWDFFMDK